MAMQVIDHPIGLFSQVDARIFVGVLVASISKTWSAMGVFAERAWQGTRTAICSRSTRTGSAEEWEVAEPRVQRDG